MLTMHYIKMKDLENALLATKDATLTHSIGKNKITDTVLTTREFCSRLTLLRSGIKLAEE